VPARTAAELAGVNRNTATLYYQKVRQIIALEVLEDSPFDGEVEIDAVNTVKCSCILAISTR
jgi:transposase